MTALLQANMYSKIRFFYFQSEGDEEQTGGLEEQLNLLLFIFLIN